MPIANLHDRSTERQDNRGVKQPYNLSPRIRWLRDYYYKGADRPWNNEWLAFTNGSTWDELFDEQSFYIVPETYCFFDTFKRSFNAAAYTIEPPKDFFDLSIAERRAWFVQEAMVNWVPQEVLPGDLLAGGRFNIQTSLCLTREESQKRDQELWGRDGKGGIRADVFEFKDCGFGNCGATSGHLVSDYPKILEHGFEAVIAQIDARLEELTYDEQGGSQAQLKAMRVAAKTPILLAERYAKKCRELAATEADVTRQEELLRMAANLDVVPRYPAKDFWQAMQSLWLTHMLILSDENYPGAGVSFGRLDQYLLPYWQYSLEQGMTREQGKEILKCFWIHCNYAYDAMVKTGDQGITAGYGQLFNLGGLGPDGQDMTNELTYVLLEVIDEMGPILEPKPNVRLHANTPDELLDVVVDQIAISQGAPFLLNFDERSMAGMLREARLAGVTDLINNSNVHDYVSVGCLENTMPGNDRSATVDCNLNLLKAVELALGNGSDLVTYTDSLWNKPYAAVSDAPKTGEPRDFANFEQFYQAFIAQLEYCVTRMVKLYDRSTLVRAAFNPTPYLSCLVKGCIESAKDITRGAAQLSFVTIEGVTFASTVDSLLAIQYLVFDQKICGMDELIIALKDNWQGHARLQAFAKNRAPKYGRDDDAADALASRLMRDWADLVWQHKTSLGAQFRPGMLSWNYWIGSGFILAASPDGRERGQFLSNAICPVNGADTAGPTANANSVGHALGGSIGGSDGTGAAERATTGRPYAVDGAGAGAVAAATGAQGTAAAAATGAQGTAAAVQAGDDAEKNGDYAGLINYLPNGASHTITLSPSLVRDDEHRQKLKSFLRGYCKNGGTALQVNILDANMLRDAQKHPEDYPNLLVRVTGYNAYFTSVGRELQDEIIARESHNSW